MRPGWVVKPIGQIADACLGKMLDKNKNKGTPRPYLRNLNVRWFNFDLSDVLEMRFEDDERERYTARKGDLLICEGGYPGRAAIWEDDKPIYFQKAIHRVRFHEPERAKWFLYYLLYCDIGGSLRSHFTGAGIQHFTGEALKRFRVPLPSPPEQQRIVAILDEAFAGLATAIANVEQNLKNARDLFDSYLHSAFTHKGEGWVERAIGEICELQSGTTVDKRLERPTGDVPYLKVADMTFAGNAERILTSSRFLNRADIKAASVLPIGTTIFPKRGGAIATNKKRLTAVPICADLNIMGVLPSTAILPELVFMYFLSVDMRELGSGSSIPQINNYDVAPLKIHFPEANIAQKKLVHEFEEYQTAIKGLEEVYRQKISRLAEFKRSILEKAFSGELTSPLSQAIKEAAE